MESVETHAPSSKPQDPLASVLRLLLGVVLGLAAAGLLWLGYVYSFSPAAIRHPSSTHFHFRLQVIVDGEPVNFAEPKFQTAFNKDLCTAALTNEPIHFHDSVDQFVHVHWSGITGGLLLKDYGWNLIGGPSDTLGYRFDKLPKLLRVPIHGPALPQPPQGAKFYVYTGGKDSFKQRNWDDFLNKDLKSFLPSASASDNQSLVRLNDVLGSAVIFAQKNQPSDQQVRDAFDHLLPLPTSSCSG